MKHLIRIFIFLLLASPAFALSVDAPLADKAQEAHAKALFHEIRCVVCVSEAIADSPAEVARDMRRTIRERIAAGEGGEQIKASLAAEYGDVILMKPPLKKSTIVLWFAPWVILLAAGFVVSLLFRKEKKGKNGS